MVTHVLPGPEAGLAGRPAVAVPRSPGLYLAGDWVGPSGWLSDAAMASGGGGSHPPEGGVNPASGAGGLDTFEAERPRLTGLAYRITCSLADAEDVVQEAWIRWARPRRRHRGQPAAWLTTVTSRLALDRLRAQRRRREVYVGPWLPDPVLTPRTPRKRRAGRVADPRFPGPARLTRPGRASGLPLRHRPRPSCSSS